VHFSCNIGEIKKYILDLLFWGRLNYLLWQGLENPTPIFGNSFLYLPFIEKLPSAFTKAQRVIIFLYSIPALSG
jgi:hypothetical protein